VAAGHKGDIVRKFGHTTVAAVAAVGILIAGCGSSSKSATPSSTQAPGTTANADATSTTEASTDTTTGASGGSGSIPDVPNGAWSKGRVHVEVSGDKSSNFESDGSGATTDGVTSAAFAQNADSTISFGFGGGEQAALALTTAGVSTTGSFGKECDITFSKHDATGIAADFTCSGLPAVSTSVTTIYKLDVKGNFTLAP
jgi:hypothetical protein